MVLVVTSGKGFVFVGSLRTALKGLNIKIHILIRMEDRGSVINAQGTVTSWVFAIASNTSTL